VVSEDEFEVHDVVESKGSLLALASTRDHRAGTILRSDDGGLRWTQMPTPLADAIPAFDPHCSGAELETGLIVTGSWIVALRSDTYEVDNCIVVREQAVAISADLGQTWELIDLPAPAATEPRVWAATEVDGRLVLGGGTLAEGQIPEDTFEDEYRVLGQAYDAALWVSEEPSVGFERLAAGQLDGLPGYQEFTELVAFDGRLFAVGNPIWQSADGGLSWSPMDDVEALPWTWGAEPPAIVGEDELLIGGNALVRGSSTWASRRLPKDVFPGAGELLLPDGTSALTWNEDWPDDASVAAAGRLVEGEVVGSELAFHNCGDSSEQGSTGVLGPGFVGDGIAALASCSDRGRAVTSLAHSQDAGQSWDTTRLTDYAPAGGDLILVSYVFVPEDAVLIALMKGAIYESEYDDETRSSVSQIIALRISGGD